MPKPTDLLTRRVRAYGAYDRNATVAEGVVYAVADFPTVNIRTPDGGNVQWAAHLCEPLSEPGQTPAPEAPLLLSAAPPGALAPQTLRFLVIEDWRDVAAEVWDTTSYTPDGPREPDRLEANDLPEGGWSDVVQWLLDHPDETRCAMHAIPFKGGPLCDQPVGFMLHEDDERPTRGGLVWRYTVLVEIPYTGPETARVVAVCEECAPDNMFSTAAWYLDQDAKAKAARAELDTSPRH